MRGASWAALAAVLLAVATHCSASSHAVLVVGSVNVDVIVPVARLPLRGETATALNASALLAVGGKGANQAVACARLQSRESPPTVFVGRLGGDAHEPWLRQSLLGAGLDLSATETVKTTSCGQGLVLLDAGGAATSVVLGGANTQGWPASDVALEQLADAVLSAHSVGVLLLQREIPQRVNTAFAVRAAARHIPVCLDAGGEAGPLSPELAAAVTYLTPNESELARLTGLPTDTEKEIIAAARALRSGGALGVQNILVTLGERGSMVLFTNDTLLFQPAAPLPGDQLVDATAAGDAFRAAFAMALVEQLPLTAGLALASAAGAIAASRLGAMPSLPTRKEVDAHAAIAPAAYFGALPLSSAQSCEPPVETPDDECHLAFASRLNSMAARWDLVDERAGLTDDVPGWIARQAAIPGISTVDLNFPQHIGNGPLSATDSIVAALRDARLGVGALCLRYPPAFRAGAFTNPDASLRASALDLAVRACTTAAALNASHVVYWSPYDGYDAHLAANYTAVWNHLVASFQAMANVCAASSVRVSLEWKPTDPASRYSFVPSTAAALALVNAVARPTFGLTLDTGHLLLAGENPGQSVASVAHAGKLFGIQLSDAHVRLGAEDGLPFGSVSTASALEVVYWLRRNGYNGHVYFDTFPLNSDPVKEAALNIRTFKALWRRAARLQAAGLEAVMDRQDGMAALELLMEGM